jgi:hypothetical protein
MAVMECLASLVCNPSDYQFCHLTPFLEFVENGVNKVMCIFETTEGLGRFSLKTVVSSDDGRTWGVRSQAYIATGTNNNG